MKQLHECKHGKKQLHCNCMCPSNEGCITKKRFQCSARSGFRVFDGLAFACVQTGKKTLHHSYGDVWWAPSSIKAKWCHAACNAHADVNLVTAFVPSDTACLANSPGRMRRTAGDKASDLSRCWQGSKHLVADKQAALSLNASIVQ